MMVDEPVFLYGKHLEPLEQHLRFDEIQFIQVFNEAQFDTPADNRTIIETVRFGFPHDE